MKNNLLIRNMDILEIVTSVNEFLNRSAIFQGIKFILAIYLIVLFLDIALMIFVMVKKRGYWYDFSFGRTIPKIIGTMDKRWKEVAEMIKRGNPNDYKSAVVEAGEMVYEILKKIGYPGETLTEQLDKMVGYQISNLEKVRKATALRDAILADANYEISEEEAKEAVIEFGEVLKEMEAIHNILI